MQNDLRQRGVCFPTISVYLLPVRQRHTRPLAFLWSILEGGRQALSWDLSGQEVRYSPATGCAVAVPAIPAAMLWT